MAGKPDLSVSPQQQQPPGVQNVVVYVSNDNFAQAYAVNQQNVAAFTSQGSATPISQSQSLSLQNGSSLGAPTPMAPMAKGLFNKPVVKPMEFPTNALLENVNVNVTGSNFYGFQQSCPVNSLAAYNNLNPLNSVPVLNTNSFDSAVKNVIGFSASASPGGEIYSLAQSDKTNKDETYITTDSGFVAVMGAEVPGQNGVAFPRCDSVRSEAAESSCSSLSSSGESQEPGVVLPAPGAGDLLMYDNSGVSVSVRPGQQLGNLVLTMVPPGPNSSAAATAPVPQQAQTAAVTVPLGWKRIITNNLVIYISPSNTALGSLDQVKEYLMTQGTCKCGLECPLKHDAVFNFDPKVNSKPYTLSADTSTGDLTKLCNHKRKLLAMATLSGTPPPQPPQLGAATPAKLAPANTVPLDPNKLRKDGGIKRKKRKVGPYSGISVSQLLAQREKLAITQQQQQQQQQQPYPHNKDQPSGVQFTQHQPGWPGSPMPGNQNINRQFMDGNPNQNAGIPQQFIRYPNQGSTQVNRVVPGSPMMVGGSMMLPQQPNVSQQQQIHQHLQNQQMIYQQIQNHAGQPQQQQQHIIGPNGQLINVQQSQGQITGPAGQIVNGPVGHMIGNGTVVTNNNPGGGIVLQGQNINIAGQQQNQQMQQHQQQQRIIGQANGRSIQTNINVIQQSNGNIQHQQEFNQRIQQQQFFGQNIQYQNTVDQNKMVQQQFDISKGIRPNCAPNGNAVFAGYRTEGMSQNTVMVSQNQQMVMMTQGPQKNPSWQQNKSNSPNNISQQNVMNSQNQTTMVPIQQNQIQINQNSNVYERVPPLHHHTPPPPVWNEDASRKKVKMSKMSKKQRPYNMDNHQQRLTPNDQHPPCPNIDVRQIPIENNKPNLINNQFPPNSSGPSFMEDPSGYLAQQTALLNSTISRQTGVNNCTSYICHSPNSSPQNQIPQNINVVNAQHGVPLPSNMISTQMKQQHQQQQVFNNRTNMQSNVVKLQQQNSSQQYNNNQIVSQNNLPDSSANNENNSSIQCQGCSSDSPHYHDQNDSRLSFNGKQQIRVYQQSQSRPNSQPSTPNPGQQQEDNPVTSSTYIERHGSQPGYIPSPDSRPIQGGTVSTSNGSPVDQNQSEPSPTPSTPTPVQQRNSDTPLMHNNSNSSNFSISNTNPVYSYNNQIPVVSSARENTVQMSQSTSSVMSSNTMGQHITTFSNANSNKLEGYCPHPHTTGSPLGIISRISGQTPFSVHSGMITTMASGRTVGHNTITSVLAGRANTSTVSINSPATVPVSSAAQNPFNSQANALITAAAIPSQSMTISVSKSPLEMVQSVVSSIQIPHSQSPVINTSNIQPNQQQISPQQIIKHSPTQGLPPGHILVSSGGQLLMASTGQANGQGIMAPPPPKLASNASPMPPMSASPMMTNVTAAVTQVIPAVAQQVLGQQTVLVNALPAPFVIQPGVVTVDGMTVGQNMQIPHLVTGNVIQQQIQIDGNQDPNNRVQHHSPGFANRQPALLSPESNKKKGGKKRKMPSQTVASMLHIASQQNSGMVMQQPQQGFSQQSFQMAHSPQGLTTGPIMQALTIVPGKAGVSPQIVMNGQPQATAGAFGTQQLITNSQPGPQINLLQPVNLLNGATGVVQNFPTIQQFIVPNLGGMVMAADGTATLVQDTSNIGMQLQLQNVNGQNVLTPVQGTGNMFNQGQSILAAGPAGMVIRTPSTQGKIIQQQHSPGAQFLSPNGSQFLMNGAQFNGQLSPLIANVSPTQQVTFSTAPQQVRPNTSMQQEFIQCNQMGQTLMVPCAPAPTITVTTASSQQNTTFVHQNTTIVQQQTTMVSNNPIQNFTQNQNNPNAQNITESTTTLNVDQNFMINNGQSDNKQQQQQQQQHQQQQQQQHQQQMQSLLLQRQSPQNAAMLRHSVSTQTAVNQKLQASAVTTNTFCQTSMTTSAGSPPDTTTHSPLAPGGQSPANADTTTHSIGTCSTDEGLSPSPSNSSMTGSCTDIIAIQARQQAASMAMVHCISSSEPDSGDLSGSQELDWSRNGSTNLGYKPEFELSGAHISRKPDTPTMAYVESSTVVSGMHFVADTMKTQESVVSSRHFDKAALKRKHSDTLVVMETRHMHTSLQEDEDESTAEAKDSVSEPESFVVGDLVWGPAHGCPSWPGKLVQMVDGAEGKVLVRWFGGDKTPTEVELSALQTLSEGLDAHHRARKKCRKSRKLNTQLEKAIQEAMSELDRMTVDQQISKPEKHQQQQQQPKSQIHNKMMATSQTIIKGEIAGRLRSSQR